MYKYYLQTQNCSLVIPYTEQELLFQKEHGTATDILAVWKVKEEPHYVDNTFGDMMLGENWKKWHKALHEAD